MNYWLSKKQIKDDLISSLKDILEEDFSSITPDMICKSIAVAEDHMGEIEDFELLGEGMYDYCMFLYYYSKGFGPAYSIYLRFFRTWKEKVDDQRQISRSLFEKQS